MTWVLLARSCSRCSSAASAYSCPLQTSSPGPCGWLEAISRYRATTSGGPNFGYDLCVRKAGREASQSLDLSSWRVAFNGAEPVRPETLDRFAGAFGALGFRREAFYPCYGLAEATLFVSGAKKSGATNVIEFDAAALERGDVSVDVRRAGCGKTLGGVGTADPAGPHSNCRSQVDAAVPPRSHR